MRSSPEVGVAEAERNHYRGSSAVSQPSQEGESRGGSQSRGPAKTTTVCKAWEATASPAAVAPLEPLWAALGWIGGHALLLSLDSEGLPSNFFHVSFRDK
jgi:hypothetical protein